MLFRAIIEQGEYYYMSLTLPTRSDRYAAGHRFSYLLSIGVNEMYFG